MSTPTTNPADLPPQLEAVIGQICVALTPGADAATKGAAAHACRVLIGVFEAQPGQPLQVPTPPPMATGAVAPPAAPVAPTMDAPIDRFLARIVEKFGGDLPAADPSVPFVNLGHVSALFAQFGGLGGVR